MRSLKIKNFKCFKDKEINFRNLTVLAGGNGAGKSTVIQSLLLFAQSFDRKDFINNPKKLYINDYYCELGSSSNILHYDAEDEYIEFTFKDKNSKVTEVITNIDQIDSNILNISNIEDLNKQLNDDDNNALSFIAYFDFISADRFGPKAFHYTDSNFSRIKVGKLGEYSALVLEKNKFHRKFDLLKKVNYWLSEIFGYVYINTKYDKETNIAMFKIKNKVSGEYESPMNMPYGVSYLLPIIISCLVRQIPKEELFEDFKTKVNENEIVIIENPEAHLHPSAQSELGRFLAEMSNYMQIIIETHSEHIINGIRLGTLEDDLDQNEILINFFENHEDELEPNIVEINIDKFNDLTDWPRDFFDQQEKDISKIFKHRRELRNDS